MTSFRTAALFALSLVIAAPAAAAERALIAVAANFAETAEALAADFTAETGRELIFSLGATGALYAQIINGAPFDALLAADAERPERLEAAGFAVVGSRFTYAEGRLALWSADPARGPLTAEAAATADSLAIANPDLAPYGAAAVQALRALGLWAAAEPRLVYGQNIGQAFAMAASGAAELGLVAAAQLSSPRAPKGAAWLVPATAHDPIRQDAVLLAHGAANDTAQAFLAFLQTPAAQALIAAKGYGP